jgi:hypothetical protein
MSYRIITVKDGLRCVETSDHALEVLRVGEAAERNGYLVLVANSGEASENTLGSFKNSLNAREGSLRA